jgi:hypothetical protein
MSRSHARTRTTRGASTVAAAVLAIGTLAACGDTNDGGAPATADEVERLSEDLGTLDDRVTELEDRYGALELGEPLEGEPGGEEAAVFTDPSAYVGQEVTLTAEISELYDTTDAGAAFRIAGEVGEQVAVITTDPPDQLLANDVVRVTGTVMDVGQQSFEENFGIAADELFNSVENFFVDADGEVAIAADSVEVVPSGSAN